MPPQWVYDAAFYHIYPLGLCDAPPRNDFAAAPVPRLERLYPWLDQIVSLNLNALYLGPVFEATAHGYDTADYYQVDRRLGSSQTLKALMSAAKQHGLRVILDGVFNHVGRDFWAFRDVLANGSASPYAGWFQRLNFGGSSPYGDPFSYEGWAGHYDLVKLNLGHPDVRAHLFGAVEMWLREFEIDGLRLDAADHIDPDFLGALAAHCRRLKPDFWLMGEVVHGDYRRWANPAMLDATTNYECYKGLYSSHVDRNYFEIAYSLNRQFGAQGIYRDLLLYSFADNHDVSRVASSLTKAAHLYPLYALLLTMPGVPSVYYGSEWGLTGRRMPSDDRMLRPCLDLAQARQLPQPELAQAIGRLAAARRKLPALRRGDYRQLHVAAEQFAFARATPEQTVYVLVNGSDQAAAVALSGLPDRPLRDELNGVVITPEPGRPTAICVYPNWARILVSA